MNRPALLIAAVAWSAEIGIAAEPTD